MGAIFQKLECATFQSLSFVSMNKLGIPALILSLILCFVHKIGPALMIVQGKEPVMPLLERVLVTLDLLGLIVLVRKILRTFKGVYCQDVHV